MDKLSPRYGVASLCEYMGVSRSGYYKWKKTPPSARALGRARMLVLVGEAHEAHRTHGYRWIAAYLRRESGIGVSDNFIYKCCRYLGIGAETRHGQRRPKRKARNRYPNLILSTWETIDRPRQVVVSDMTAMRVGGKYYEVTFYFDAFTKEILSWRLAARRGDRMQYIDGLRQVVGLLEGSAEPTVLHTDQGSVYASAAYNELLRGTSIIRSMSRAGKPTDNPVNESLNGWIKEELFAEFHIGKCRTRAEVARTLEEYVGFYNERRPCSAIGYDTPREYHDKFLAGVLPRRDTFKDRQLSEVPKFVQRRRSGNHPGK